MGNLLSSLSKTIHASVVLTILLFLGLLSDKPIIGLPGCAKSPATNGADWVLSRVVCGQIPSEYDFARMGVGGLLKENSLRPMPRLKSEIQK